MRIKLNLLLLFLTTSLAQAAPPSGACDSRVSSGTWIECGSEQVKSDDRPRPSVVQPTAEPIVGSCGEKLPAHKSYNAQLGEVSCGTAQNQNFVRLPLEMSDKMRKEWKIAAARHDQNKMQEAHKQEQKFVADLQLPMTESWTWQEKVGGFNSRFGTESYTTQCSVQRTKHTSRIEEQPDYNVCIRRSSECENWETDRNNCLEYEADAPVAVPIPSTGGGSLGGGSNYRRDPDPPKKPSSGGYAPQAPAAPKPAPSRGDRTSGAGESKRSQKSDYQRSKPSSSSKPSGGKRSENIFTPQILTPSLNNDCNRNPARSCIRYGKMCTRYKCAAYGTKNVQVWDHTNLGTYTYSCEKVRPLWGEWLETRNERRSCRPQPVSFKVSYETAKTWVPGYTDTSGKKHRNYHDSLPNQWDLLAGESERLVMTPNLQSGTRIVPSLSICSRFNSKKQSCEEDGWNDYQVRPQPVACKYDAAKLEVNIFVDTIGRNVLTAPNPLRVVTDGSNGTSLVFDSTQARPSAVLLEDTSRTTMMDAALNSRTFGTNEEKDAKGASASGGYWLETRFKMRLLRLDRSGKTERTTIPNTFGSNQGDIFDQTMTISLEGKDGLDRLYRPGGPAEFIFGGLYKHFGVELTPGETYLLKVALVQRGLPWYITGCRDGKKICEGEDGTNDSYSEEIDVKFVANPNVDNRSWFKRLKDWQKHFRIL